ncbi:hypothetical protein ACFX12_032319 [Malus domestica]
MDSMNIVVPICWVLKRHQMGIVDFVVMVNGVVVWVSEQGMRTCCCGGGGGGGASGLRSSKLSAADSGIEFGSKLQPTVLM